MSDELKAMLESLTTDELKEVQTVVGDLISIAEEQKDPAMSNVPYDPEEEENRPF